MPLRGAEKASASPAKFSPQKLSVDKQKKNRDKKATSLRLHLQAPGACGATIFTAAAATKLSRGSVASSTWQLGSEPTNPSQPSHASSVAGSSAASGRQLFDFTSKS
ncbi:hypothetical protein Trisim1_012518 [Trichoderma cf. simile WF8]